MRGENQRHVLQVFPEAAGQVRVPRVTVHDVYVGERACHHEILKQRRKYLCVPRILRRQLHGRSNTLHVQIALMSVLIPETQHLDGVPAGVERSELSRQILHMHSGATVDVRRIFVRQHSDIHKSCSDAMTFPSHRKPTPKL